MTALNTSEENCVLSEEEIAGVTGGFPAYAMPVGIATRLPYYAAINRFVSPLDIHALNPQPLPPRQ